MAGQPPRDASLPPGYDEADPYADEDLSTYPDWWRRNIEKFREYGMRPYRPSRLADGTLAPPLVAELESEFGVEIRFRCREPESGEWAIAVDGEAVRAVDHERDGSGYTVYGIDSETLRAAVCGAAQCST
jgi:hypothetical protein